ncbi:MAG: RNA polymerase sigma factor [Oscillospiraceae bacterium]|jgi:DNA-directed RNA polymerase specialized sigma24 family protein|nr:RNA polymerase sigma factor [Oscillospiraceae bacterium]
MEERLLRLDRTEGTKPVDGRRERFERAYDLYGETLYRICVNLCRSRHRAAPRRAEELTPDALPAPDAYSEGELLDSVRRLPPKLKSVVVLHCCEGYTLEETATLLKISLSACKMRLSRAREKLKLDIQGTPARRPLTGGKDGHA